MQETCSLNLIIVTVIWWQVNQKMILTLAASIMYWSLQKAVEDGESSPSPSNGTCTGTPDASPAPSVNGEDEISSLGGEVSNLNIDDVASDTTVSSQLENEEFTAVE
jgi:plastin-1